jgi:hypothetical protein
MPCFEHFGGESKDAEYREGSFVGYRFCQRGRKSFEF